MKHFDNYFYPKQASHRRLNLNPKIGFLYDVDITVHSDCSNVFNQWENNNSQLLGSTSQLKLFSILLKCLGFKC